MNLIEENLEIIHSINLHNMTMKEYVNSDNGIDRFHFFKGSWWREVKPFFYQPASFMKRIYPRQAVPKPWLALGGYYHMVPDTTQSNGKIIVNEISNPKSFRLEELKKKVRYEIKKSLSCLRIYRITNLGHLFDDGYKIYLSWENRIKTVRVKRSNPVMFRQWISKVFRHPYKIILGAYYGDKLISYVIFDAVDGVANLSKVFNDLSFSHLYASSALIYAYIKICAHNPMIQKVCNGLRSHRSSLEHFKAKFGFHHITYPAYIHLRPFARPLARYLMPTQYRRLMGYYDNET